MDAIASVAFEMAPAGEAATGAAADAGNTPAVFDVSHFDAAYAAAANPTTAPAEPVTRVSGSESQGLRTVMEALDSLNGKAESLGSKALQLQSGHMQPSDILMMTLRAQEFLFHCELTSNVANRTSEGVQQLFREQS